jgi:hypothetical protein
MSILPDYRILLQAAGEKENGGALCAPPLIANNWPIIACQDSDLYYSGGTMFTVSMPWMAMPS